MPFEKLFSPIKLRGLELKNRVLMPGMDTKLAHNSIGEEVIAYHLAVSGAAADSTCSSAPPCIPRRVPR